MGRFSLTGARLLESRKEKGLEGALILMPEEEDWIRPRSRRRAPASRRPSGGTQPIASLATRNVNRATSSVTRQGGGEIGPWIELRLLVVPGFLPSLPVQRVGSDDDKHVELVHQSDLLTPGAPGEVETWGARPGGYPVVAVPNVAEVAAHLDGPGFLGTDLQEIPRPIGWNDPLAPIRRSFRYSRPNPALSRAVKRISPRPMV